MSMLSRHHRQKHKDEILARAPSAAAAAPPPPETTIPEKFFSNPASLAYFKAAQQGDGIKHLVGKAVHQNTTGSSSLDPKDVFMFMTVAHFVATLTHGYRESNLQSS